MALTEYDISFATKEYLHNKGYTIITWNPPGSQGTFTIPNPSKDPLYRGQTGSESPDLIVFNQTEIIFIEAKDNISKSFSDIEKIINLLENKKRRELLFLICKKQMEALGKQVQFEKLQINIGIAIPYEQNFKDKYVNYKGIKLYAVKALVNNWNNKVISSNTNFNEVYKIIEDNI